MTNEDPIGLFDSGIGGTSIWKAIHKLLPEENTIYLSDSKNAPYGLRSKDEIIALSIKNTELLLELNCKMIVVACNTATTNAVKELRSKYDVPFIGIEPAIKPAAANSQTQTIGILATKGTLSSELFGKAVATYQDTKIIEQIGHGLVELIENGKMYCEEMTQLLKKYLEPMIKENIDYLVLGCSHYPYLIPQIRAIIPAHIQIIDSGEAVAKQTYNSLLAQNYLNREGLKFNHFYTNTTSAVLANILDNQYTVIEKDF